MSNALKVGRSPVQWLLLAIALLILGSSMAWNLYSEYRATDKQERERLITQARIIDENLTRQLLASNLALNSIRADLPFLSEHKSKGALINRRLQAMSDAMPGVRTLLILDASGKAMFSNREQLIGQSFQERAYFQNARRSGNPDIVHVSRPFKTVLGVFSINLVKTLVNPRGEFDGVISATLDSDYFNTLLGSVRYAPDMAAYLLHADGDLIFSLPSLPDTPGAGSVEAQSLFEIHRDSHQKSTLQVSGDARAPRITALMTVTPVGFVADKLLVVGVDRDQSSVFSEWRRDVYATSGIFAAASFLSVLFLLIYQQRQRTIEQLLAEQEVARTLAQTNLLANEERLKFALVGAGYGVWDWNIADGRVRYSERWLEMHGFTHDDVGDQAQTWEQRVHPDDVSNIRARLHDHLVGKTETYSTEHRALCKDGRWMWVVDRGRVVSRDAAGKALRMVCTHADITERMAIEAELVSARDQALSLAKEKSAAEEVVRELNETLEQRVGQRTAELELAHEKLTRALDELAKQETNTMLATLVASVSHELSTPLGNSLIAATTLVDGSAAFQKSIKESQLRRSEVVGFVASVHTANELMVRNLGRATNMLQSFRQVVNDQASEERRSFDLAALAADVLEALSPTLRRHPHRVELDIAPGISMDSMPGALGQVIVNLVNNAYLHAFEGRTDGVLRLSAKVDAGQVLLRCMDNGVGILPQNVAHLFEPFFTTKKGKGGTGLGMAIVSNLVHKTLGGSIAVESERGMGTTFNLTIPLLAPELTGPSHPAPRLD